MCSVKIRQSEKEIEKIKTELEQKKKAVMEEIPTAHVPEYESFSKNVDNVEEGLRSNTVGLVTLSQMKEKQRLAVEERERQIALRLAEDKVNQILTDSFLNFHRKKRRKKRNGEQKRKRGIESWRTKTKSALAMTVMKKMKRLKSSSRRRGLART